MTAAPLATRFFTNPRPIPPRPIKPTRSNVVICGLPIWTSGLSGVRLAVLLHRALFPPGYHALRLSDNLNDPICAAGLVSICLFAGLDRNYGLRATPAINTGPIR